MRLPSRKLRSTDHNKNTSIIISMLRVDISSSNNYISRRPSRATSNSNMRSNKAGQIVSPRTSTRWRTLPCNVR